MDYNQDFGVNRLHVLDDTNVSCDKNACAIFNGGIYVEKDIYAANIHIKNFKNNHLKSNLLDVSKCNINLLDVSKCNINDLTVNKLNVKESVCPNDFLSSATLGTCDKKWNGVYSTNGYFQTINGNICNLKNLKYDNLITICSVQNKPVLQ